MTDPHHTADLITNIPLGVRGIQDKQHPEKSVLRDTGIHNVVADVSAMADTVLTIFRFQTSGFSLINAFNFTLSGFPVGVRGRGEMVKMARGTI
jgi:hypothetical protein